MYSRELTITFGTMDDPASPVFATSRDSKTGKWIQTSYGSDPKEVFARIIKTIIKSVDDPQAHYWK